MDGMGRFACKVYFTHSIPTRLPDSISQRPTTIRLTIMAQVVFLSFKYHEWDGAEWDGNHAYEKKWRFDFINHTKGGYDTIPMTECSEVKLRLRTRTLIHPDFFLGRD